MRFKDVIGHSQIKQMLVRGVDSQRVSHAQLFSGASGYGTLPMALAYAQYVNCTAREGGDSCGVCSSCRKMEQLAHPDLHFVFPVITPKGFGSAQKPTSDYFIAQWRETIGRTAGYFNEQMWYEALAVENQQGSISRNEADEILRKLSFKSFEAEYKIMIIWLPEKMRIEASNTLLKILEEPWDKTLFLMVSETPSKLLSTIISRTQEVAIGRIALEDMQSYLQQHYSLAGEQLNSIARLSGGDLIEAARLIAGENEGTSKEHFENFMQLMRLSYNDRHMELLEWSEGVASMGREEQKQFLQNSVRLLRESYMLNAGMSQISYLWGEELDFCKKFSPFIGNHNIEKLVSEIELTIAQITQNGNPKIIFAHFALVVSKLIIR